MTLTPPHKDKFSAKEIRVCGLVQGVGFRPTVWRLARQYNLVGTVLNDGGGVLVHVWGSDGEIDAFLKNLRDETPPLARIDTIDCHDYPSENPPDDFTIIASNTGAVTTSIVPDAATCEHCLKDISDPNNRRFRYPFTNCTHCGPRLSITRSIPYDRENTSMAPFVMCKECRTEYQNPADRRFHAQPNSCAACGPALWICADDGKAIALLQTTDAIFYAGELIRQGKILAIKGIGGFHLACDATNDQAVAALRKRKKRYGKPLALMADGLEMVGQYVNLFDSAVETLQSAAAPIVLLEKKQNGKPLAHQIAPDQTNLGFMLAYTPLHHLLLRDVAKPLVMTSGNISSEPQVTDNDDALKKLSNIADYWLMHDRDIVNRLDDSVMQRVSGRLTSLRRARGFAPDTLKLPKGFENAPGIMAMGGELKNTFCLLKNGTAIVSQHIGDLEDASVHADYRKAIELYQTANSFVPDRIAVDMHPGYFSTRWGEKVAIDNHYPIDRVQHHHAHIAACLAEHQYAIDCNQVLGIALDGLGYGDDGTLWGGEFLVADYCSFERLSSFEPVAIPGGEKASYEPWRNTFAHLHAALGWPETEQKFGHLELVKFLNSKPLEQIATMIDRHLNAPKISSAGRLFDAVAGALNIFRDGVSFEGQAAMALQAQAERWSGQAQSYNVDIGKTISWKPVWTGILNDLSDDLPTRAIAARFHNSLISVIAATAIKIARDTNIDTVVLSGGVFQNKLLCEGISKALSLQNLKVLIPQKYPANDGGISLGQAIISAARVLQSGDN